MIVAPDPYEFDDDPEDSPSYNGITNTSSRQVIDPSSSTSFTNQDQTNWTMNNRSISKSSSQVNHLIFNLLIDLIFVSSESA